VVSLLSQHSHKPTQQHYIAGKRVLAYLQGTLDRGIRFVQGGSPLHVNIGFPTDDGIYTDANWGPQDASHPKDGETTSIAKVQSLLGHVIFRMHGPVSWGCCREKDTISRSSCESEIYSTDEGTKYIQSIRHILQDLGQPDGFKPTPLWNDNRGCVDWAKGCTVSRKLRHINMRDLSVRLAHQLGHIDVRHIAGKRNIADLFTKEMKDVAHFREMAFTITSPRKISDLPPLACPVLEGGVDAQGVSDVRRPDKTILRPGSPTGVSDPSLFSEAVV
jgi:hypothetical protein